MPTEQRVTLLELDIDNSAVIKKQGDLLKQINELKKANKDLKKDTDNLTSATDEQAKAYVKTEAEIKKLSQDSRTYNKILQDQSRAGEENIKTITKTDGSINSLRNALNVNKTAYKSLTKAERESDAVGGKLLQTISKQDEEYKELSRSIGNNQVDVGNYKLAVEDLAGNINIMGVNVGQVIGQLKSKASSLKGLSGGLGKSTSALGRFRIALISTGIGAIVVLLGTLIAAFLSTQKGVDSFNRAIAPLKGIFQGITSVVQKLAVEVFQSLGDRFTIVANSISNNILRLRIGFNKLTGDAEEADELGKQLNENLEESAKAQERVNKSNAKLTGILKNSGKEIEEAIKREQEIVELNIKKEKLAISNTRAQGELSREIKAQNKIAEDTTKPLAEREKATIASIEASKKLLKSEQNLLDIEIEILKNKQAQTDTSREDLIQLAELEKQRADKETASLELQTTQTNKLNTIRREAESKAKKAQEERLKKLEEELQLAQTIADQNITLAQQELEIYLANNETRIKDGDKLSKELISQEVERLKIVLESTKSINQQELENKRQQLLDELRLKNITQEEANNSLKVAQNEFRLAELEATKTFNDAELELNKSFNEQKLSEDKKAEEDLKLLKQRQSEARLLELQNELESLKLQGASKFELLNAQLNLEKEQALIKANELGVERESVVREFAEREKKINRELQNSKFETAKTTLSNIASILGEESVAFKAFAIAQASIDTYLGANRALASAPPPFNFALASSVVLAGLGNVAKIAGFADGSADVQPIGGQYQVTDLTRTTGTIKGTPNIRRSNGDNMLATVKTGEAILNKKQQSRLNNLLGMDAINYAVKGYADGTTFTSPTVQNNINRNIVNNSTIDTGFSENNINLVVDVKDIVKETGNYSSQIKDATI